MEAMNGVMPTYEINKDHGGDCYGYGGMWFMWIIIMFALMGGWGGNGFGNRGVDPAITNGFNNQDTQNALRGIQNGLCDGFYAQNTTMLNGFNGVQRDLCTGLAGINANINEGRFAAQQCLTNFLGAIKKIFTFDLKAVGTCA